MESIVQAIDILNILVGIGLPIGVYFFLSRKERADEAKHREFEASMKNLFQKIARKS